MSFIVYSNFSFFMEEMNFAISRLKNNKAPGPDGLPSELFKWLNEINRNTLLRHINKCWDTETLEDCMNDANLATIYKKGPTDRPENYRPIALLNITYKILAIIIHVRLCDSLDNKIDPAQFGFRKKRARRNPYSSTDVFKKSKRNLDPAFTLCYSTGKRLSTKWTRPE